MKRTDLNALAECHKKLEFLDEVAKKAGEKKITDEVLVINTSDPVIKQYIIDIATALKEDMLMYISEIKVDFKDVKM